MNYKNHVIEQYQNIKDKNISLDMSRGKPSPEQLDTLEPILSVINSNNDCFSANGTDCRNYGAPTGIDEVKELFAQLLDLKPSNIFVGGNSSLKLMYDTIVSAFLHGVTDETLPWSKYKEIKFLCPVPGYDRHFAICEHLNIKMISVPMDENGPDMDVIEKLVSEDETIKGCWCVPKYSNPTGVTYSPDVVSRFANLKPKAKDFRVFWDNAYIIHHLTDKPDMLPNIVELAALSGNPDIVYQFASTAKITYAGAGVSCVSSSAANIARLANTFSYQTIGFDKLNMLRHARMFPDIESLELQMKTHRELILPKFEIVFKTFEERLSKYSDVKWSTPKGGYFITLYVPNNTAKNIVSMAKEAGLVLTPAGATHPYGTDPLDNVIRIAPTFPSVEELQLAAELLCYCVELAILP